MAGLAPGITVVIPTIPSRKKLLERALQSVERQTLPANEVIIEDDSIRSGAAAARDRGTEKVITEWTAFLDDDDEWLPEHLLGLMSTAAETEADLVYAWFDVVGGTDPLSSHFGVPWDPEKPHLIPVTFMVKTALFRAVGGFSEGFVGGPGLPGEDWHFTQKFNAAGYKIVHRPEKTHVWHHHGRNTSGLADNW